MTSERGEPTIAVPVCVYKNRPCSKYSVASYIVKMVKSCVAAGCSKTSSDGVSFFKFPSDPVLRQRWTKQVQRTRACWNGPSPHSVLCINHFSEDCFEPDSAIAASMGLTKRRRLKQDAIPTIFDKPVQHSRTSSASGSSSRKRAAAITTTPEDTQTGRSEKKRSRGAFEKRERSRVMTKRARLDNNIIITT